MTDSNAAETHHVSGHRIRPPFPAGLAQATFGLGCFWGAERRYGQLPGVYATAVGYAGGAAAQPSYKLVCTGTTNHAEVVRVIYDPAATSYEELLRVFWESHDPTQGNRQGADVGTQYRSVIFWHDAAQCAAAEASREHYQSRLSAAGRGRITTQIAAVPDFWYAEDYHQQYLAKNPNGYCGLGGCGVPFAPAESPAGARG